MIIKCPECYSSYDDEFRTAICPHKTFAANDGKNNFAHHPEAHLQKLALKDLGLTYEEAAHGVQTAIAFDMQQGNFEATTPKHMRTGIDMSKADMAGLANLLINKGVITLEEYTEAMRLGANHELATREDEAQRHAPGVSFR